MTTAFGDSFYVNNAGFVPFVGMTRDFEPNNVGNTTGALGVAPCGTPEQWLNGCLTSDSLCECAREDMMPRHEIPSGDIDGNNRQFFLSELPITPESCLVFLNGDKQGPGVNYTLTGKKVFFSVPSTPRVGDDLWVYYMVSN